MGAPLLFADNTVLINFAIINRMDLLKRLVSDNGRWCLSVAHECDRSAEQPGLGALSQAKDIFGPPMYPDASEYLEARVLRDAVASPGDRIDAHLGEAETLAIMIRRNIYGFFVTDDREAARLATQNKITVVTTWRLLRVAGKKPFVDADALWGYVQTLRSHGRGAPPDVNDRESFDLWLTA